MKLRQFAERSWVKGVAARHALLPMQTTYFDEVLRTLRARSILPRGIADLFYHLKRTENVAAHEDAGSSSDVLTSLKIAREIGVWFHRSYEGHPEFKPDSFVPPVPPTDVSKVLADELAQLKRAVIASADSEAKAVIAAQDAERRQRISEDRAEQDAREKVFWENYAAETEATLCSAEAALSGMQAQAAAIPQRWAPGFGTPKGWRGPTGFTASAALPSVAQRPCGRSSAVACTDRLPYRVRRPP